MKEQKKRESDMDTTDYGVEESRKLYPAIELLRDPDGLAESVLKRIQKTGANSFRFEHKLLAINFVTRLVGNHELLLLNLYPFLRRYMGGHQRDVTQILAYTVQSCHETVPPEEVHSLLQTIAHNFITERCSGEQIAVGIIRIEIQHPVTMLGQIFLPSYPTPYGVTCHSFSYVTTIEKFYNLN